MQLLEQVFWTPQEAPKALGTECWHSCRSLRGGCECQGSLPPAAFNYLMPWLQWSGPRWHASCAKQRQFKNNRHFIGNKKQSFVNFTHLVTDNWQWPSLLTSSTLDNLLPSLSAPQPPKSTISVRQGGLTGKAQGFTNMALSQDRFL